MVIQVRVELGFNPGLSSPKNGSFQATSQGRYPLCTPVTEPTAQIPPAPPQSNVLPPATAAQTNRPLHPLLKHSPRLPLSTLKAPTEGHTSHKPFSPRTFVNSPFCPECPYSSLSQPANSYSSFRARLKCQIFPDWHSLANGALSRLPEPLLRSVSVHSLG